MSPEQLTTADVDARSDIYSLGMTFYEMLAGQLPFTKDQRENPGALTLRISNPEPFQLPSNFYPHIPKRIESIVMRMLEKDINKRYSSMTEVLNELQQFNLSDPERTMMEEYEKTVAFDRTILTEGKRSDSDVPSSSSKTPTLKDKPIKEMTWEERQERGRLLEAEFREKTRLADEEKQRKLDEERRQREEEARRFKEEKLRKEKERQEEIERTRLERERKLAKAKAKKKKLMLRTGMGVICVILLIVGFNVLNNYLKEKQLAEEKAAHEKQVLADLKNNMVVVEGKTFTQGDKSWSKFEIAKIEVTQELWESMMGSNPSSFRGSKRPVENVSWYDAVEFCNKLSEKEGLQKAYSGSSDKITCDFNANGYRLPTEAEWEYAARGGYKSKGYEYSGSNEISQVAWYNYNSGRETYEVGKKQPNELGIYDMSGNVWEWCWDKWDNTGSYRVLRGGSWRDDAEYCRVAIRNDFDAALRYSYNGFRLVRTR